LIHHHKRDQRSKYDTDYQEERLDALQRVQ